ncbi:MAG: HAD family hydrolase [Cyanobacteria bacterium J06626_23]
MNRSLPDLIAFDFDGVICDGLVEYFQTSWRAYCQLFQPASSTPPEGLAERFYRLRPVIETGWEMPVLLQALLAGETDEAIIAGWPELAHPYLGEANLTPQQTVEAVDGMRDEWIKRDLDGWLALHRFYPGMLQVLESAMSLIPATYIVSTKEGRFIRQLLEQNGVEIATDRIIGKEIRQPKYETLRQLMARHQTVSVWFIEDRIKALKAVKQQADLTDVKLFLADWGYNLAPERETARQDGRIDLLSLGQLVQRFE